MSELPGEPLPTPFGLDRESTRTVAFSDGVFAIAITLLVLEIRPPQQTHELFRSLLALWPSYLSYVVTFMLIGQIWANHHVMFDHIRSVDRVVLFLNTVLLMDIAFLPFSAGVLAEALRNGAGERTAVVFHGLTFELVAVLFNSIWEYARRTGRLLSDSIDRAGVRAVSWRFRLALIWIAVAIAAGAVLPVLGLAAIVVFIVFYWLPIRGEIANATRRRHRGENT